MREKIVLSLGGSIAVPDGIDTEYLKAFREVVREFIDKYQFYIIVGGGALARQYQAAGRDLGVESVEILDLIGIRATRLNAEMVKAGFGDLAEEKLINAEEEIPEYEKPVIFGGGTLPGWSTDYVAVTLAEKLGAKTMVNLTNMDYVFNKNPKEFPDAVPMPKLTWPEMWQIVGTEWRPGANIPFDQRATEKAEKNEMTVIMMNGKNIDNLRKFLKGETFVGSTIK
jgi:uridylate kinase